MPRGVLLALLIALHTGVVSPQNASHRAHTPGGQCRLEAAVPADDFRTSCRRVGQSPHARAQALRNDFQALQRENTARRAELGELSAQYAHLMATVGVLQSEAESWRQIVHWPLLDQERRRDNSTVLVPTDQPTFTDCLDAYQKGHTKLGLYALEPQGAQAPFFAFCDGEGWTLIERRYDGSTDFYRSWDQYQSGFGEVTREFWLGLEKIHLLTGQAQYEFRMEGLGWNDRLYTAEYPEFSVAGEQHDYQLTVANMSLGNVGDALSPLNGQKFTTHDNDNDDWYENNCAEHYHGAWWLLNCGFDPHRYYCEGQGCMSWGERSLKKLVLKVRPAGAGASVRRRERRPALPRPVYPTRAPATPRPPAVLRPTPAPTRPYRPDPPATRPPFEEPATTRKPKKKKKKKPKSGRPKRPKKPKRTRDLNPRRNRDRN